MPRRSTIPVLVEDVATTLGYWMPAVVLAEHVMDRFGMKEESISRAISRMIKEGKLIAKYEDTVRRHRGKPFATKTLFVKAPREMWESGDPE